MPQDLRELAEQARRDIARHRARSRPLTIDDLLRPVGRLLPQEPVRQGKDPDPNLPSGPRRRLPSYRVRLDQQEVAALAGVLGTNDPDLLAAVRNALAQARIRIGRAHPLEAARRADVLFLEWRRGRDGGDFVFPAMMLTVIRATADKLECRPLGAAVWNGPSQQQVHRLRLAISSEGLAQRLV